MNSDLQQVEAMIATLATSGRIRVSGEASTFAMHNPIIEPSDFADFAVRGRRRRHVGEARTWQDYKFIVAKLLVCEKRRLVVQDCRGAVQSDPQIARQAPANQTNQLKGAVNEDERIDCTESE